MKIALIGNFAPPYGGITVHLSRLSHLLNQYNIAHSCYSRRDNKLLPLKKQKSGWWFFEYLFSIEEDIIHYHLHSWVERFVLAAIARIRSRKIIFTIHSLRENWRDLSWQKKLIIQFLLKFSDLFICVGENEKEKLISWGCPVEKVKVIAPVILPNKTNKTSNSTIHKFIKDHPIIISANGSNTDFYKGNNIYGLDMCIELCNQLKDQYDVGFIYCLSKVTNMTHLEAMKQKIIDLKIDDRFLIVNEEIDFCNILEQSHVFLRPTNTDSYGISVAEALHFQVPTIASDVCPRPMGTILFRSRDQRDLFQKVQDVLVNWQKHKSKVKNIRVIDGSEEIIKSYYAVANQRNWLSLR